MNIGDFLLCTFQGDTASPPTNYVAEITSIDPVSELFSCRWVDTAGQATFQYSSSTSGPWYGSDGAGTDYVIETHDIYAPAAQSPAPQDVAIVTLEDNNRYLCYVESVSPATDISFYHSPYPRMSFDSNQISASDWDLYPVGSQVISIERCVLNNEIVADVTQGIFNNGWWSLATRRDAHAGRIGGHIDPFSTVVHTTDVVPEEWNGVVDRWTMQAGNGSCAHFTIGRDANEGVIQLVPITRNANHAGGDGHGAFVAGAQSWHPNLVSIGIELNCAGDVRQIDGHWRFVEQGVAHGAVIPDADVIPDPDRPGRGWHTVTDYQYRQLGALLDGLETVLNPLPAGCVAHSIEAPPPYGIFPTGRVVGHVSLTAARRGDPWPLTCDWLRAH